MKCPWLIVTVTDTNNRNSYNDSRRSEKQAFGECHKEECPFYSKINKGCLRVNLPENKSK